MSEQLERMSEFLKYKYNSLPTCPWCDYEHDPADMDGECYDQDETGWECFNCDRSFTVIGHVSWTFSTFRAGGEDE